MEYTIVEETMYNGVITIIVAGQTLSVDLPFDNPNESQINDACQKRADEYAKELGL